MSIQSEISRLDSAKAAIVAWLTENGISVPSGSRLDVVASMMNDLAFASADHTHTAAEVGAAAAEHGHAPADIGAATAGHSHSAAAIGAIPTSARGANNGVATLDGNGKVTAQQASSQRRDIGPGAYTLQLGDAGKFLFVLGDVTLTIPTNSSIAFPLFTEIEVYLHGTSCNIVGASGVSILSLDGAHTLAGQFACACLKKIDVNHWVLAGALA